MWNCKLAREIAEKRIWTEIYFERKFMIHITSFFSLQNEFWSCRYGWVDIKYEEKTGSLDSCHGFLFHKESFVHYNTEMIFFLWLILDLTHCYPVWESGLHHISKRNQSAINNHVSLYSRKCNLALYFRGKGTLRIIY